METPETSSGLISKISEFWPYIVSAIGVIGTIWGYVKFAHGKGRKLFAWFQLALDAPNAVAQLRANMVDRAEFVDLKTNVQDMRRTIVAETASRRALFQHSDTAFFEADSNGRMLWVNTAYLTMVDRELHEVTDNNWRNSIHDLDRPAAVEAWRTAVADNTDYRFKFRVSTDTAEFWVIAEALCTKDDLGNVLKFVGALRKIADPRGYAFLAPKKDI